MDRTIKMLLCALVALFCFSWSGRAQRIAISSDAVKWAALSPNLGFEIALSQHHAFSLSAATCPVKVSDALSVTHITVIPEYKYWLRMPFYGHYMGANLLYSSYEAAGSRYSGAGNIVAACVNYGYSFIINSRWNVVPFAGVGIGVDVADKTSFIPLVARIGVNFQLVVK